MRMLQTGVFSTLCLFWAIADSTAQDGAAGEEIVIEGEGYTLPATLNIPDADGPIPCVVFFQGSGPTDRNWNSDMFPQSGRNGSAQQLAEALGARGGAIPTGAAQERSLLRPPPTTTLWCWLLAAKAEARTRMW